MTLFTLIWGACMLYGFTRKNMNAMVAMTLLFMTFQCANVISFGGFSVGPQILTSMCLIVRFLIFSKFRVYKTKYNNLVNVLLVVLFIEVIISALYNNVISKNYLYILQLTTYVLCFVVLRYSSTTFDEVSLYEMLRGVIIFVAVVGILQWLATMDILPIKRILKILFYNDDSMNIYFNENDYYHNSRVYSTFMEPSYLAGFAVGAFYYLLSLKEKWKSNTPLFIILLIEIVLSTSSTAYAAIVLVGVIFIVNARQISLTKKCTLVFCAGIAFAVLYLQYYELLEKVLFNKWNSNSGVARRIMDNDALNAFYSSKLLGVGYKCVRGSSVLYSMLGEIGIIGTVLYTTTNAALYIPIINNIVYSIAIVNIDVLAFPINKFPIPFSLGVTVLYIITITPSLATTGINITVQSRLLFIMLYMNPIFNNIKNIMAKREFVPNLESFIISSILSLSL